jgi:hypothetical protein
MVFLLSGIQHEVISPPFARQFEARFPKLSDPAPVIARTAIELASYDDSEEHELAIRAVVQFRSQA